MEKNLSSSSRFKVSDNMFFLLVIIYQLAFIFQGLSFNDEGFHLTFYQQIFKDPQSVQYNFMYWFSGIVGGAYLYLFPNFGIFGIRVLGILTQTFTIIIVYRLLKKYINITNLRIGLFMGLLMLNDDPKDMYYDNLTIFLYIAATYFLFTGIAKNKLFYLFISGVFLSLNFFTRLPNILGLGIGIVIVYHAFLYKKTVKETFFKLLTFTVGFVVTTVAVILVMKSIGHLNLFIDNIKLLSEISKSKENTHGLSHLIPIYIKAQIRAFKYALMLLSFIILSMAALNIIKAKGIKKVMGILLGCAAFALLAAATSKDSSSVYSKLLSCSAGLTFIATLLILVKKQEDKNLKLLALSGSLLLLIMPFGSDYIYASERYAFWLCLPVTANYYFSLNSFSFSDLINLFFKNKKQVNSLSALKFAGNHFTVAIRWTTALLALFFIYYSITQTWNDSSDRTKMVYAIENRYSKGIFTTKSRADAVNELLRESSKYVKQGDYVLAYDAIPMYHYMTQTKPFMSNSWPWLYDRAVFKEMLYKELAEKKTRPVVIFQKVNTVSSYKWPSVDDKNEDWDINAPRNETIKEYLANNNYRKIWENIAFCIYIPQ